MNGSSCVYYCWIAVVKKRRKCVALLKHHFHSEKRNTIFLLQLIDGKKSFATNVNWTMASLDIGVVIEIIFWRWISGFQTICIECIPIVTKRTIQTSMSIWWIQICKYYRNANNMYVFVCKNCSLWLAIVPFLLVPHSNTLALIPTTKNASELSNFFKLFIV